MSGIKLTSDTLAVSPAAGELEYNGQFFGTDSNASRAQMQRIVRATAQASTSGTSIDFTGIPSWAKRITVMLSRVSTGGTSNLQVQIGSGTFATSGYSSLAGETSVVSGTSSSFTTGFGITQRIAIGMVLSGNVMLTNINGNTWVSSFSLANPTGPQGYAGGGSIALGDVLDRIRITTVNGTDTFDAGSINILYEG